MKKFDLVNPVIGKLATQVRASKLTDYQLTKKILNQDEVDKLQLRLDALKYGINKDDDDDEGRGGSKGGGGRDGMPGTGLPLPRTPQQEMEDIVRRLDFLRGKNMNKKYLSLSFSLEDLIKNLIRLFGTLDFQVKIQSS